MSEGQKRTEGSFLQYKGAQCSAEKKKKDTSKKQKDKNTHRPWELKKMTDGQAISFKDIRKGLQ